MSYLRRPDAGLSETDYCVTLDEVARHLGVTRERARQIEIKALFKVRRILEQRGFTVRDLRDWLEGRSG